MTSLANQSIPVLVTGATGFVGKPLCDRLVARNNIISATIRSVGDKEKLPSEIKPILINSLCDALPTEQLANTEVVIYLAARVHQMNDNSPNALDAYREINTKAAISLAKQAAENGVTRFIYLSSIKVNGEGLTDPYSEKDTPNPIDPYGQSKWEAEQGLLKLAQETGLEVVIIRAPLIYGPNVKANFLQLLKIIDKSIPLPFGAINNARSILFVGNLVDAIITCLDHPNAKNQTFVVSDGDDLSTTDLMHRLGKALGKSPLLLPIPTEFLRLATKLLGKADIGDRLLGSLQVDSSKIRQMLDWTTPYTVDQGLQATADWFKSL
jgi:nucleoside-diphosphate-sugar epimerase